MRTVSEKRMETIWNQIFEVMPVIKPTTFFIILSPKNLMRWQSYFSSLTVALREQEIARVLELARNKR
jgi:hypothetical protein